MYIVALGLHLLASLLCHLTALNKSTLIAEGCGWKNSLGGKDCETGTQNAGNFSVKNSHFRIMYVYFHIF
jgi:hypothetical protein